jgi:hypothetical protein
MTDDSQDFAIGNAVLIIERFGGIRPMATKMGIPVTTVQGWKQRNAIPVSRREDILRVAVENRINLDELLADVTAAPAAARTARASNRESFETAMPRESYTKPLFYAGILMLAGAIIGGVVAIAPRVQEMGQQEERIRELQAQLELERQKQEEAAQPGMMDGVRDTLTQLEGKVQDLSKQAEGYTAIVDDLKTGSVQQRIGKLEGHMNKFLGEQNAFALSDMLNKVGAMQQSPQGMSSLQGMVSSLIGQIDPAQPAAEQQATLTEKLTALRETDPAVAQTFEGVAPEDMKAAVALIGLSQLRNSLMRDKQSFSSDLQLLKMTVAKDDPQLQEAIDRLAPQAEKGVLTPDGLSKEFRSLAGDIAASSLKGEDVQLEDRVKARLNNIMVVEKNGQQISGTPTQQTIAEAQAKLDQGDVQGAIASLQTLQGPAAQTAQPFINEAQATLMAGQLQQMIGVNVLKNLQIPGVLGGAAATGTAGAPMVVPRGESMKILLNQVMTMIPAQGRAAAGIYTGAPIYMPGPNSPANLPKTPPSPSTPPQQ